MLRAKSSQLSFYGNHIYERVIPEGHFLKLLDKAVDFSFVNELCRDAYTPDFGRPAYEPEIMAARRERPKIERKFAELKRFHGLREARYWGLAKVAIQFTMTAIDCNLKRIFKLFLHQGCLGISRPGSFHQGITVPTSG